MEYLIYVVSFEPPSTDFWTIGTAITSVIIALIALIFSWKQSCKIDQHNRLMVTPHISSTAIINNEKKTLAMHLMNDGIGPAIIKDFKIHIDGNLIKGDDEVELAVKTLTEKLTETEWGHESLTRDSFVSVGTVIELATIESGKLTAEEMKDMLEPRIKIQIFYQSIYGEKFTYDSDK